MTVAVGYTRLSQSSDTSIPRQKRHIRDYCDRNGLTLDRIYDDGENSSGFDSDRTQYRELRARLLEDRVGAVIVNDQRRLARDVDEVMRLIPDLRENSIELHTCQDGQVDLSDPMRAAIEILSAAAAHLEKQEEIEKSIEAVEERLENGYDHGPPKFGMEYRDDGKYQRPGDQWPVVDRILNLSDSSELSIRDIASEIDADVSTSTVHRIIEDREWYRERERMHEHRE